MKLTIACLVLGSLAVGGLMVAARGAPAGGGAGAAEVASNPAALVSPSVKVGELSVHGVKLGDSTDKIAKDPAFTRQDISDRPKDTLYAGREACYYAYEGRIYRITVLGELARRIPTYDGIRLQMAMGKADQVVAGRTDDESRLCFYARHIEYTVRSYPVLSVVTEVNLYDP